MKRANCLLLRKAFYLLAFTLFLTIIEPSLKAQGLDPEKGKVPGGVQLEFPSGEYIPSPRETHPRSAAYRYFADGFSIVQVNVDENGDNILNDAANEPSITFNSENPDEMVIGWRQFDNINNSFRQAGFGFTVDGGQSWTFPGVIDPGIFRSDPVLRNDSKGNIYYNSLTSQDGNYWTNVYKSTDGGGNWEMGTFAQGGDKQWMAVDMTDGIGGGNIYEFWNGAYSLCSPNNFTRSVDGNESYESCSYIPGGPYWGTNLVSPSGDLYVCGAEWGGFMVAKSSSAQDPGENASWDWTVSVSLGGEVIGFGGDECPNPEGLLGQTIIAMDSSGGPGHGNIYLLCSVQRFTNSDPCDVMFARSTDGGLNWSTPVRVNDDLSNFAYQWFGTMSVAPDGRIDAVWLDTRGNLTSVNSALYYSYSLDQGVTWTPNVKLSETFDPHIGWPQQFKMGDYFDMYSDDAGAHLAWAATFNGEQDVYYSLITPSYVGVAENAGENNNIDLINYPDPFKTETTIRYWLSDAGNVSIKVYNISGKEVATVMNETREAGMHEIIFNASGLESGIYFYQLNSEDMSCRDKFIILK